VCAAATIVVLPPVDKNGYRGTTTAQNTPSTWRTWTMLWPHTNKFESAYSATATDQKDRPVTEFLTHPGYNPSPSSSKQRAFCCSSVDKCSVTCNDWGLGEKEKGRNQRNEETRMWGHSIKKKRKQKRRNEPGTKGAEWQKKAAGRRLKQQKAKEITSYLSNTQVGLLCCNC